MTVMHLVAYSAHPTSGGVGESVSRIADGLLEEGFEVIVYTLAPGSGDRPPHGRQLSHVRLGNRIAHLLEPYRSPGAEGELGAETARVELLCLQQAVAGQVSQRPTDQHVLVSFYATNAGFLCQHVALRLGLPHIASFRGTDFARDTVGSRTNSKVRFVVERADQIVATNREQADTLRATFDARGEILTIHNAIHDVDRPAWSPPTGDEVRIFSDCGFSGRKATHLLVEAVESLLKRGLPIGLTIVGSDFPFDPPNYWASYRENALARFPGQLSFPGPVAQREIDFHLLRAHIYCSATLAEGCSLSRIRALTLGIPIVTTRCGALPEVAADVPHVRLCAPGDFAALCNELESAVQDTLAGSLAPDEARIEGWRRHFSTERERRQWREAIESVIG